MTHHSELQVCHFGRQVAAGDSLQELPRVLAVRGHLVGDIRRDVDQGLQQRDWAESRQLVHTLHRLDSFP